MSFAPVLQARDKRQGGMSRFEWVTSISNRLIRYFLQARREVPQFPVFGISRGVRALGPSRGAKGQTLGWGGQPYLEHEKCGRSTSSRRTGHHRGRGAPDIEAAARRIIQLARPVLPPLRRQWHLTGQLRGQGHATKFTLLEIRWPWWELFPVSAVSVSPSPEIWIPSEPSV